MGDLIDRAALQAEVRALLGSGFNQDVEHGVAVALHYIDNAPATERLDASRLASIIRRWWRRDKDELVTKHKGEFAELYDNAMAEFVVRELVGDKAEAPR